MQLMLTAYAEVNEALLDLAKGNSACWAESSTHACLYVEFAFDDFDDVKLTPDENDLLALLLQAQTLNAGDLILNLEETNG